MTCIVGYIDRAKDTVHIAGDSAGVAGLSVTIRKDPKVFKNGPFIMGFTSSFRMGQLLMSSKFKPPKQKKGQSDYEYMITDFIDEVRDCFKEGGYIQTYKDGDEKGGTFLVGYKGELYQVDSDFQVGMPADDYASIGCGEDLALGAMHAITRFEIEDLTPKELLGIALEAASHFSGGVEPPYTHVEMSKTESEKISEGPKKTTKKKPSKKNKDE